MSGDGGLSVNGEPAEEYEEVEATGASSPEVDLVGNAVPFTCLFCLDPGVRDVGRAVGGGCGMGGGGGIDERFE